MQSKNILCIFILLTMMGQLQSKAVGRKGKKKMIFQDFAKTSPIQIIPQWFTISDQETAVIPKGAPYTPIEDKRISKIHENKSDLLTSTLSSNSKDQEFDSKFDLLNHDSLEQILELEFSDSSHSWVSRRKRSSGSYPETMYKTKHKPPFSSIKEPFEEDQVFVEKKQKVTSVSPPKMSEIKSVDSYSRNLQKGEAPFIETEDTTCRNPTPETPPLAFDTKSSDDHNSNLLSKRYDITYELEKPTSKLIPNEMTKNATENVEKGKDHLNSLDDQSDRSEVTGQVNLHSSLNQDGIGGILDDKSDKMDFEKLDDNEKSGISEEDMNLLKDDARHLFDVGFNPFVFNPQAQPQEKFQECFTKTNESGHCRYVQHCMLPSLLSSVQQFMDNVCIIQEMFIGICCPEFPASILQVQWPDKPDNFSLDNSPAKTHEDCGVGTNTRIVGGSNADRRAWPWMVALLNDKKKFFCGGSLINDRYVLTAAHCTFSPPANRIIARLGEHDLKDTLPHDDYEVIEIKRHGQYTRIALRNDIALLKLEKPAKVTEFSKSICLPESPQDYVGKTTFLAGWGHVNGVSQSGSNILQESSFPIINNTECSETHSLPVPPSLICAAAVKKDTGACNGDSGGPLMLLDDDERWKVIGLVSWGRRGCNTKFPTVYTRVTHYLDWIKEHAI